MQRYTRSISIDVCDYTNKALCNLYSSASDMPGQAFDVFVHTERNGHKELRFNLPSVLPDGEPNYRMDYLISDYRLKFQVAKNEDVEIDWFLISESKITHEAFSKNYEVKANHISSLLNTKNLELEFSDEEGNNVGTIGQIAATILDGTGWHLGNVAHFYEEEKYGYHDLEKIRSFSASSQTGAFKMMSDLCELFDAKPIYHGQGTYIEDGEEKVGRTVDIIPMNPFSEDIEEGSIPPAVLEDEDVIELYYDKNIKNMARTLNTDNIVTKLSAYGSYGDRNGLCSLQEATHAELTFNEPVSTGEYCFEYQNSKYFFTSDAETSSLKWSALDFSSRSYVYDGVNLFKVYKEPNGQYTTLTTTEVSVKNYVPYIMDFTYYDKVGLLTDDMLRVIANHQMTVPAKHIAATEASVALASEKEELMRTASSGSGFLMLDISASAITDGNLKLTLEKSTYPDGVIYRSDYDEAKRNYFTWSVASGIKLNGEAIAGKGAVVYIVHNTTPTTWEKAYVRYIGNGTDNYYKDNLGNKYSMHTKQSYEDKDAFPVYGQQDIIYEAEDTEKLYAWFNDDYQEIIAADYVYGLNDFEEPSAITLWMSDDTWHSGDKVYLFSADSIAGLFGPREDSVLSNRKSVEEAVKTVTEIHPLIFTTDADPTPSPEQCLSSYGWYYHSNTDDYTFGDLHFCWGANGDVDWSNVYISRGDENPETITPTIEYGYYYSVKRLMLYTAGETWTPVKGTVDQDRLTANFASVIAGCINQEVLTKGVKEEYFYDNTGVIAQGNYAFKNEFDNYWLFTTTKDINPLAGDQLRYKYSDKLIWQDDDQNNVIKAVEASFTVLEFPTSNDLYGVTFSKGNYENQSFTTGETYEISNNIYVHDNVVYEFDLPANSIVVCLDANNRVTAERTLSPFETPNHTTHVRIVCPTLPTSSNYFRLENYSNILFSKNKMYKLLPCSSSGERMGLTYLMDKFIETAHEAYQVKLPALQQAQKEITDALLLLSNTLGDIYREGCWRKEDYVEGDEHKLYADALDNLKEISHPEATYDVSFLDLYGSRPITEDEENTPWPDIEITYAVHLVDPDIDTNKWAYIDSVDKCYDQPWKTELEVNTRLSMIGQQSFTDVLTKIAEVANETKANQSIYKRASALTSSGQMAAERLEGAVQTNKIFLLGGTSNWYTDSKGNIIFEAADGNSAMMLTGRGLCVAQSKDIYGDWDFRTAITGNGINADSIYTGYLSAERLEAGSITTDKLSSNVGQELDIGSNVALNLYATVDGTRPAGSLITQHPDQGDSWIAIGAENGNDPAYIDVQSGGQINIYGGSEVNVQSQGELNLAGGTMNITSQGKLLVSAGEVDIQSTGKFAVTSDNFRIQKNATTGLYDVFIAGCAAIDGQSKIAGFTLGVVNKGQSNEVNYLYAGSTTSMNTSARGVYIGNNGINLNGTFKVTDEGYLTATSGEIAGWHIAPGRLSSGAGNTYVALSTESVSTRAANVVNYRIWAGASDAASAPFSVDEQGNLVSTRGSIGGWNIGQTTLTGNKTGLSYTTLDNDIAIWAGNATASDGSFYVRQDGYMKSASGNIGGWSITSNKLYSGSGDNYVALSSTDTDYRIWAGNASGDSAKFSVKKDGTVKAEKGSIAGWTINTTSLTGNKTGLAKTSADSDIAIWAGNATASSANFYVRQDGYMKSKSGEIAGWTINDSYLYGNVTGIAKTTNSTDVALWAGKNYTNRGTAAFRVTQEGKLYASGAEISGSSTFSGTMSAACITSGTLSANYISGGTLTLGGANNSSGSLSIKNASNSVIGTWNNSGITAEAGTIGGWTISGTSSVKRIYSGSGATYVGLDSGSTSMDYAMWAGADSPTGNSPAPFRVKRNGEVYITKLSIAQEDGTSTTVNLSDKNSSYPMWKLNYSTVKSATSNSITLTDGTTINFNTASSLSIQPDGAGSVYIYSSISQAALTGTNKTISVSIDFSSGNAPSYSSGVITLHTKNYLGQNQLVGSSVVTFTDGSGSGLAYDAGNAAGITTGKSLVGLKTVPSSHTVEVDTTNSSTKSMTVALTGGSSWSAGKTQVNVTVGGTTMRTENIEVTSASNWSATYISNKQMAVSVIVCDKVFNSGLMTDPGYNRGWNDCINNCTAHTTARWGMESTTRTLYYHDGSSFQTWSSNGGYKGGSSGTLYEIPSPA